MYQVPVLLAVSAYNQGMVQARSGPGAAGDQYGLVPIACRVLRCGVVRCGGSVYCGVLWCRVGYCGVVRLTVVWFIVVW